MEGNFRELTELKIILPYSSGEFEENETLLYFDKILLAAFEEQKRPIMARGGKDNQPQVIWDKTTEVKLDFYQGVFSKNQLKILTNSVAKEDSAPLLLISRREKVETNEKLEIELTHSPIGKIFAYGEDGKKYKVENLKIIGAEPYQTFIIDYFYNYNEKISTLEIGNKLLNGFVRIEAKTKFKDELDGKIKTVLLIFPRVKIYSNLVLNFGENAPFNLAQMKATAYKSGTDFMEVVFLDEEITSD